ncbi:MAG: hypothetical protein QM278_05245 [Pseudomonadota bacterium]|nr:hypothetical protein [Pseudomonadota bacterium]
MGALIESVAVSRPGLFRRGSVDLAVKAATDCLLEARLDPNELGLLINVGIYRDRDIGEPSIASFIQRRIKANELFTGSEGTFSFDLNNGAGGMITAIMALDGFLASGAVKYGLVVASDAEPHPGRCPTYPFVPAGAALVLSQGRSGEGFLHFRTDTFTEYAADFSSRIEWTARGRKNKNILVVKQKEEYARHCARCVQEKLADFLKEISLSMEEIDIVIPTPGPPGWREALAGEPGMSERMMALPAEFSRMHTAGLGFALMQAREEGRFARARNCLFLTVGSGITVGFALYRNPS